MSTQLAGALEHDCVTRPNWVEVLREKAAEQFHSHGLPTRKDEAWKYTSIAALAQQLLSPTNEITISSSAKVFPAPIINARICVNMLDGKVREILGELPPGVTVLSMADAFEQKTDGLQSLLESLPESLNGKKSSDGLSTLNSAMLGEGLVIHVAAGTDAGQLLLKCSSGSTEKPVLYNSRICILLEKGARLEYLEQFESAEDHANSGNLVLQVDLGKSAQLQHIRLLQECENAVLITRTDVSQQANSEYAYFGFDLGGGLVRHDVHSNLLGNGAKASLNGVYLLDGHRHVDNHARVDHRAPQGTSEQYFRGVAAGSSRAVFNTTVYIHRGADGAQAKQSNANILLSARAEIDTKPELEIYADEVIANHGATVGRLDEQAVFYLRSRGLNEHQARHLLTTAFCRSVSDRLSDRSLADVIAQRMMDVMPQGDQRDE